jgi:hypothetical protein
MFKPNDTALMPVRLLRQDGDYWRVSTDIGDDAEFSVHHEQLAEILDETPAPMRIHVPFPVGSEVWVWWMTYGREPVKVIVETISIWMDKRYPDKIKISYNFEHDPSDHRFLPDGVTPFATREEAIKFRDEWMETAFPKPERLESTDPD